MKKIAVGLLCCLGTGVVLADGAGTTSVSGADVLPVNVEMISNIRNETELLKARAEEEKLKAEIRKSEQEGLPLPPSPDGGTVSLLPGASSGMHGGIGFGLGGGR